MSSRLAASDVTDNTRLPSAPSVTLTSMRTGTAVVMTSRGTGLGHSASARNASGLATGCGDAARAAAFMANVVVTQLRESLDAIVATPSKTNDESVVTQGCQ